MKSHVTIIGWLILVMLMITVLVGVYGVGDEPSKDLSITIPHLEGATLGSYVDDLRDDQWVFKTQEEGIWPRFSVKSEEAAGLSAAFWSLDVKIEVYRLDKPKNYIYMGEASLAIVTDGVPIKTDLDVPLGVPLPAAPKPTLYYAVITFTHWTRAVVEQISGSFNIYVFVDLLEEICGLTIGFWKTNAEKDLDLNKGRAQVNQTDYIDLLECVNDTYGSLINDWGDWRMGGAIDSEDLEWGLHWLSYGAYNPDTGEWTKPEAKNATVKARAQLLALLLTACYKGSDYTDAWLMVEGYEGLGWQKVSDWISYIIFQYNAADYKAVYDIANYLNEHCALLPVDP